MEQGRGNQLDLRKHRLVFREKESARTCGQSTRGEGAMQKRGSRTMQRGILVSLHLNGSLHMCRVTPTSWAKTVPQERTICCQMLLIVHTGQVIIQIPTSHCRKTSLNTWNIH